MITTTTHEYFGISRDKLIEWDKPAEYIPFASTVTSFAMLYFKATQVKNVSFFPGTERREHNYNYVKNKNYFRCAILTVPAIGNIIIILYDLIKCLYITPKANIQFYNNQLNQSLKVADEKAFIKDLKNLEPTSYRVWESNKQFFIGIRLTESVMTGAENYKLYGYVVIPAPKYQSLKETIKYYQPFNSQKFSDDQCLKIETLALKKKISVEFSYVPFTPAPKPEKKPTEPMSPSLSSGFKTPNKPQPSSSSKPSPSPSPKPSPAPKPSPMPDPFQGFSSNPFFNPPPSFNQNPFSSFSANFSGANASPPPKPASKPAPAQKTPAYINCTYQTLTYYKQEFLKDLAKKISIPDQTVAQLVNNLNDKSPLVSFKKVAHKINICLHPDKNDKKDVPFKTFRDLWEKFTIKVTGDKKHDSLKYFEQIDEFWKARVS